MGSPAEQDAERQAEVPRNARLDKIPKFNMTLLVAYVLYNTENIWSLRGACVSFPVVAMYIYALVSNERHHGRSISTVVVTQMLLICLIAGQWLHGYVMSVPEFTLDQVRTAVLESVQPEAIHHWAEHYFTSGPHLSGQNEKLANWTRDKFIEFGFPEVNIETYDIWVNYPADHRVALLDGDKVVTELSLEEDVLEEDPTTQREDRIPTFHGFSASGNATGRLVYANYGLKSDYDKLVDAGVSLKDKVVLVRYGGIFRGLKVKGAEELGAAAVLIYSDPGDDGDYTEANGYKAYPDGGARNPSSVQRGSVQDLSHSPGDPTTPGWPSTPDANRTAPEGIPGIPSIPISYRDALPLLKALNGHGKDLGENWHGGLDGVDYTVGPSELEVNVYNEQDYDFRPNRDVIAKLPGKTKEEIIIGNHWDAWIIGGADPNSGSAAVLELARALGNLYEQGWRPQRTIVFASWDGEEYGLLGSTEWGEDHAKHLQRRTYAYLNSDVAYSGTHFSVSANPLLARVAYEAAALVPSPFKKDKESLWDVWNSSSPDSEPRILPLGSGSDYTVFQDHLGIPSLDFGFEASKVDPVYHYHSNYDSLHWMETYGDTKFEAHAAAAKFLGLMAVTLSEEPVVPFSSSNYAEFVQDHLTDLLNDLEDDDLAAKVLAAAAEFRTHALDFELFTASVKEGLNKEYKWYEKWRKWVFYGLAKAANGKQLSLDRVFLHNEGLEDRPWFKHVVFAPGRYTGYAGQVFPAIAESFEDEDYERLALWLKIIRKSLRAATKVVTVEHDNDGDDYPAPMVDLYQY